MVNIQKVDNVIKFTFTDSDFYLYNNGTIEVPLNSLSLYIDESDMITYKKANSNDIFVSVPIDQTNFSSKADAIDFYKENMVGAVGSQDAFTDVSYDSSAHTINFYNEKGDEVATLDATAFIKDGMVNSVAIDNGYLVITFNVDAGKETIRIPLSDIFDSDNYYDKQAIDTKLNDYQTISGLSSITLSTFVNDEGFITNDQLTAATSVISTALATLSGEVDTNEEVTSRSLNLLNDELQNKQDTLIAGDNIAISGNTISATVGEIPTKLSELENDCGFITSSVTDSLSGIIEQNELIVASALVDLDERKADLSGITDYSSAITEIQSAISAINQSISGINQTIDTKEQVIAIALNDLNTRLDGLSFVKISQTDYDNLVVKDADTVYIVIPD